MWLANKGSGVCKQVVEAESVKAYLNSKVPGVSTTGAMPIGSNIKLER